MALDTAALEQRSGEATLEQPPPEHDLLLDEAPPDRRTVGGDAPTVLVIGGAGYVGSVLCRQLLDAGYHVRVLDAFLYGDGSLNDLIADPRVDVIQGDTRDPHRLGAALDGMDTVVHLGEIVGDPACSLDPTVTVDVNVKATIAVARAAKAAGVTRFVYPSSCSVYGASDEVVNERSELNPVSLYARGKIAVEHALLGMADAAFEPVILRFATIYGISPRPRFDLVVNVMAAKAQTAGAIVVDGGDQWRPFVHVADAAAAVMLCLRQPAHMVAGEIFNVGSNDQNHTIGEIAEIIRHRVPGSTVRYGVATDMRNYRVRFDKVRDQLGYMPTRLLVDGIDEIRDALASGLVEDFTAPSHSNVRAMKETDAGERLARYVSRDAPVAIEIGPWQESGLPEVTLRAS